MQGGCTGLARGQIVALPAPPEIEVDGRAAGHRPALSSKQRPPTPPANHNTNPAPRRFHLARPLIVSRIRPDRRSSNVARPAHCPALLQPLAPPKATPAVHPPLFYLPSVAPQLTDPPGYPWGSAAAPQLPPAGPLLAGSYLLRAAAESSRRLDLAVSIALTDRPISGIRYASGPAPPAAPTTSNHESRAFM